MPLRSRPSRSRLRAPPFRWSISRSWSVVRSDMGAILQKLQQLGEAFHHGDAVYRSPGTLPVDEDNGHAHAQPAGHVGRDAVADHQSLLRLAAKRFQGEA